MKGDLEFSNLFSPAWQDFQERKNRIKTACFKVCSKCGEIKPIFKFSVDNRNTDGRRLSSRYDEEMRGFADQDWNGPGDQTTPDW